MACRHRMPSACWDLGALSLCLAGAGRKSCAITTAKRLAAFLGDERIKDKGLACQYVIARVPQASRAKQAPPLPSIMQPFMRSSRNGAA